MATAIEYGLIAALIGIAVVVAVEVVDTDAMVREREAAATVLDADGNPTYASIDEALDSGNCRFGAELMPPPNRYNRVQCAGEEDAPDEIAPLPSEATVHAGPLSATSP